MATTRQEKRSRGTAALAKIIHGVYKARKKDATVILLYIMLDIILKICCPLFFLFSLARAIYIKINSMRA